MGNSVVNLRQNSFEWLEWRRKGLGASDAAIILGISEYKTPLQLWENKLGLRPDDPETFITQMGHKFEPKARAQFALLTGIDMKADVCKEHPEFPFLRASLDGCCEKERAFAEIKLVGKKKLQQVRETKRPPDDHIPQVQQQHLVTKFERGFYICYTVDEKYQHITDFEYCQTAPDKTYGEMLFTKLNKFWKLIETQTPPELEPRDEYEFKDAETKFLADNYITMKKLYELNGEKLEEMANQLKALANKHTRVRIGELVISKSARKGNVDYKLIPQLKGLDLEQFRGKPSLTTRIDVRAKK
jgi:putative phage-type endonuclease